MDLSKITTTELKKVAKKYKLDLPKDIERAELEDAVEKAAIKHKLSLEAAARAELAVAAQNKLGIDPKKKHKPSPETIHIKGGILNGKKIPPSKKKYYLFHNNEEAGVKVALRKGEKYRFELHDGKIHILPAWLVDNLRRTAVAPIYEMKPNPITGLPQSVHTGNRPRFGFDELDEAPDDAVFGVVIDKEIEAKYLQPV